MRERKPTVLPPKRTAATGGTREQGGLIVGLDGRSYPPAVEEELNRLSHLVFNNANGQQLLEYLKNITINATFDHTVPNDTLRHVEGQRFIVGVLVRRAKQGAREK